MPEYFAFDSRTKTLSPDERANLFLNKIVDKHPEFYAKAGFGSPARIKAAAERFFDTGNPFKLGGFGPLTDARLRAVARNLMPAFNKAQADFATAFPDFRCNADIEFGVSLFHFDGRGHKEENGREHMRFGVDMIALLHPPEDLPAFFAHELFHVYHAQLLGFSPEDDERTWWAMWAEGLATYVSRRMNAPLTEQRVLWFPQNLEEQMEKPGVIKKTARQMLMDFNTSDHYSRWFLIGYPFPGVPPRAGYFMGLRMAEHLGQTHSLYQLAHLTPAQVKPLAKAFLEEQAR